MDKKLRIRAHLPVLAVSYLHGRGEFFCTSFARIDNGGFMQTEVLKSSDPVFGVRVPLPQPLEVGKRYLFNFRVNPETVEYILIGNRTVYERMALPSLLETAMNGSEASMGRGIKLVQVRAIAEEANPLVTFVRDRAHSRWVQILQGKWRLSFQGESEGRHCSEWSEVDDELSMGLRIDVQVQELPPGPEDIRAANAYHLLPGLRFWKGPALYHKMPVDRAAAVQPPPIEPVDYPTDQIMVIENEDGYEETRESAYGSKLVDELESHLDLCERYGVTGFWITQPWTFIPDQWYREKFIELLKKGKGKSLRYISVAVGGPPVEQELNEGFTKLVCEWLGKVLNEFPRLTAVIRIMEINTNGQWPRPATIPDYLFSDKIYDKDLYELENKVFIEAHRRQWKKMIDWVGYPDRTEIIIQDDGPVANPYWYEAGASYFITKNIWGFNTNLVQAFGRGFARAFGKPIGLAYDSHRGLDYEGVNPSDVEQVYRSYFFAGMEKTMYEAPFHGSDETGQKRLTESGAMFYNVYGWMKRHPRRGEEIVRIGFLRGSDDYGIRNPVPGPSKNGYTHRLLVHNHPAYRDWQLLNTVYPEYGDAEGSNPYRFLTGTPYGQADVVPCNAPPEHLSTFHTLVMTGKNRLTEMHFGHYLKFVQDGGKLVLALEHLLDEQPRKRKYADLPLEKLTGIKLGRDVNILPTHWQELVPSATCFYNQVQLVGAEILEKLDNGDPLLVRNKVGKGEVYFFTSEYLTSVNPKVAYGLLEKLFADSRLVTLSPVSGWVQHFVRQRNGIVMLGLINHGQAGFPQGHGPKSGPWHGKITISAEALGRDPHTTEAFHLDEDMTLRPIVLNSEGGHLTLDLKIDTWSEVVLGPKDGVKKLLFETRN
jgi:hypothetical protein